MSLLPLPLPFQPLDADDVVLSEVTGAVEAVVVYKDNGEADATDVSVTIQSEAGFEWQHTVDGVEHPVSALAVLAEEALRVDHDGAKHACDACGLFVCMHPRTGAGWGWW